MKRFHFYADAILVATDLEDAAEQIGKYFIDLARREDVPDAVFESGEVDLSPADPVDTKKDEAH